MNRITKRLEEFKRGWLVGNFDPALLHLAGEVGLHYYDAGDSSDSHFHRFSTEFNIIVSGECEFIISKLNDSNPNNTKRIISKSKDIIIIHPYEICKFIARTDCVILCIRDISKPNDKVII